jgi:hypothetical protein
MADTLEIIYLNENLGLTELSDGEHTILTTDAATSYVIKDMYVKNTDFITSDTRLELNGFDAGSLTSNATGSLIVPPNSTLKVKSSTYPLTYLEESLIVTTNANVPKYERSIRKLGGTSPEVTYESVTAQTAFSSYVGDMININYNVADDSNPYFYAETTDNNSAQSLQRIGPSGGAAQVEYSNYIALGTGFKENGDFIGYRSSSTTFYVKDFDAYPTSKPDSSPTLLNVNKSPYPESSYPRHFFAFDHIWFVPSSSYPTQVYAVNVNNGSFKSYTGLRGWASNSGNNFLTVSHDISTDKMYIWRMDGTTNAVVTEISQTKTEFLADNSSGIRGVVDQGTRVSLPATRETNNPLRAMAKPQPDGGIMYMTSNNYFESVDITGARTADPFSSLTVKIGDYTGAVQYYRKSSRVMSPAEVTSAGVVQPTFGIQLLGVKSEI